MYRPYDSNKQTKNRRGIDPMIVTNKQRLEEVSTL